MIDQDAAQGLGRRSQEVTSRLERLRPGQTQVRLMDQGGRVEGVAGVLGRHPRGGEFPQLVVDEREQVGGGPAISGCRGLQKAGHVGHVAECTPQGARQRLESDARHSGSSSLAEGMAWHFVFMWLFAINGLLSVLYTLISGEWRELVPNRRSFRDAFQVTLHDLHLRKFKPPQGKYNGAQKIAYTGVILMGAGSLLTGLAIYKPVQLGWLTAVLGGYEWARWEHFWLTIGYVLFIIVHGIQVIREGWNNFRSMIMGYELVSAEEKPQA